MYFFVQIERALLGEGLEADGALERPLPCAAAGGTGEQRNKQNDDGQTVLGGLTDALHMYSCGLYLFVHQHNINLLLL